MNVSSFLKIMMLSLLVDFLGYSAEAASLPSPRPAAAAKKPSDSAKTSPPPSSPSPVASKDPTSHKVPSGVHHAVAPKDLTSPDAGPFLIPPEICPSNGTVPALFAKNCAANKGDPQNQIAVLSLRKIKINVCVCYNNSYINQEKESPVKKKKVHSRATKK